MESIKEWRDNHRLALKLDQFRMTCSGTLSDAVYTAHDSADNCQLLGKFGSRSIAWRMFLGLLPSDQESHDWKQTWVKNTR